MMARFILGYLRSGLNEDNLELLNMDQNDWEILMEMFADCCQPPDFVATMVCNLAPGELNISLAILKNLLTYVGFFLMSHRWWRR